MRQFLISLFFSVLIVVSVAQSPGQAGRKYPSLFWEITGNGLKKPSYLFGTMHVSSKLAFNLSDSFYLAIKKSDVVALETNPESWQEDMLKYDFSLHASNTGRSTDIGYRNAPSDYLRVNTLKTHRYEKRLEAALNSSPSVINNLLYRAYSDRNVDFEEDTYLDLYIYQVGKKWKKKIVGVERYAESMKLAMEAYRDGVKDKGKKERSFERDDEFSPARLQDAYRTGNLDLLDTIGRVNSMSAAFDEKFLYRRNEIQASSIDSILKSRSSLFVGVGAAHLPGQRGVIEMLRMMGYRLRPIKMAGRSSRYKEEVDKLKVPVRMISQTSDDGFYKVDAPGKLQRFSKSINGFDQAQYADMANGSYYSVTRVQTNAASWGHSTLDVARKVDSLLYENIPGKILSKQAIKKNGYGGFSIINKTRRGDYQRYNIFVTPFEVIFFKMSGSGEFLKDSLQSQRFFSSIRLKEFHPAWQTISPSFGGFEVDMPHEPYTIKNRHWHFMAHDVSTAVDFAVIRTDIHQYDFTEHDTIDLNLLEESFTSSEYFEQTIKRQHTIHSGHAALDARYRYKNGSIAAVRFLIQGPHYYTLVAVGKSADPQMERFINSFKLLPSRYGPARQHLDTALHFTVTTPYFPSPDAGAELPPGLNFNHQAEGSREGSEKPVYKDLLIAHDSTGEKIYVSYYHPSRYYEAKDSSQSDKLNKVSVYKSDWIKKAKQDRVLQSGMKVSEVILRDASSSRAIWTKTFYKTGVNFTLRTVIDSISGPGIFQTSFFETFLPADTIPGMDLLSKKSGIYFNDFFSADSSTRQKALNSLELVKFDATDVPLLQKAIASLNWDLPGYLDQKKEFIYKVGSIASPDAAKYLKDVFYKAGDTIELQYAALEGLVKQKNKFSYQVLKDILINDPPVLNTSTSFENEYNDQSSNSFLNGLYDSLELTAFIIKELLPLINVDDYKYHMLNLMRALADRQLLSIKDYESYVPKLVLEAKQAWKKQLIRERRKSIRDAERKIKAKDLSMEDTFSWDRELNRAPVDDGNELLHIYSVLLIPDWTKNRAVPELLNQFLISTDKALKYHTALLLLRHHKGLPDTLLPFFAKLDEYRFRLYKDLEEQGKSSLFPAAFNNHPKLAQSKLIINSDYREPDSIVFLQSLQVGTGSKEDVVYFFKYKRKRDDSYWKIASLGPVLYSDTGFTAGIQSTNNHADFDLTEFSNTRLKNDVSIEIQLRKKLSGLLLSRTKGGRLFYQEDEEDYSVELEEP